MKKLKNIICHIKTMAYNLVGGQLRKKQLTTFDKPSIFERVKQPTNKFSKIMSLLSSKNGFRGEYLARYIVSRFAFISESSVGEDFGIDFYCGLSKESTMMKNNKRYDMVYFSKPFFLQIKTNADSQYDRKNICYDSREKIETLYNFDTPFFVGYLNLKTKRLDIHSTSSMYYPYHALRPENIDKVAFKFRKDLSDCSNVEIPEYVSAGNGERRYYIDLGKPIISITIDELERDNSLVNRIREILSNCIDRDFENIISKKLDLSYYRWMYEYETNNPLSFKNGYKFINKADSNSYNIESKDMLNSLHPYLVGLALSFKNENDIDNYKIVRQLIKQIDKKCWFKNIDQSMDEMYNGKKYTDVNYVAVKISGFTETI